MKKVILSLLLVGLFIGFAPAALADTNSDYQSLRDQLIILLQKEIAMLQQQIQDILAKQASVPSGNTDNPPVASITLNIPDTSVTETTPIQGMVSQAPPTQPSTPSTSSNSTNSSQTVQLSCEDIYAHSQVSLDGTTPLLSSFSFSSVKTVTFLKFKILNESISRVVVSLDGGYDNSISGVSLYSGSQLISSSNFINGKAEFNHLDYETGENVSKVIAVIGTLSSNAVGNSIRLGISSASDISGVDMCGESQSFSFPDSGIWGNYMTIVQ